MGEGRRPGAKGEEELDLGGRVGHVIVAADDVADREVDVVDHRRQGVEIAAVGADQDRIALACLVDMLGAAHQVDPGDGLALEQEAPVRPAALALEAGALGRRQRQRGPVIDRRLAALQLALALQRQLLRGLVAGIEPA